jgi:hypothetical protein
MVSMVCCEIQLQGGSRKGRTAYTEVLSMNWVSIKANGLAARCIARRGGDMVLVDWNYVF